jgi:inorganic pyrophosphatase
MDQSRWRLRSTVGAALLGALPWGLWAQTAQLLPAVLPAAATADLAKGLAASAPYRDHPWARMAPINPDGTVNVYVEIARGDRRKWEFDIGGNRRAIDRWIPKEVGGYPVNYGFVPQTVFLDGDPFDALVLGPALAGGHLTRGIVVGVMFMEDGGLADSKVVVSPTRPDGTPQFTLTASDRRTIAEFFGRYKQDAGTITRVPGWGSAKDGVDLVHRAHAFFTRCAGLGSRPCEVAK